jgi:predicted esterase
LAGALDDDSEGHGRARPKRFRHRLAERLLSYDSDIVTYRSTRERPPGSRFFPGLVVVLLVLGVGAAIYTRIFWRAAALLPPLSPATDAGLTEDQSTVIAWCADGLEPIVGGGCLALPAADAGDAPAPLVIYLHGLYEQDRPDEELDRQRRVAARATARGFAVLALRGGVGVCHPGVPDFATRFCWPSNEQVADRAHEFVDGWSAALRTAEQRAGRGPRTVLGFSSGGYFAALLAARSLFAADSFVVAHGGPVEPIRGRPGSPPVLLLSADDDVAQGEMVRLDDELTREGWAHDHRARDGSHGLTDGDIDIALSFATRVAREGLPLRPPLAGHAPRWREREAGGVAGATPDDDAGGGGEGDTSDASATNRADEGGAAPGTSESDAMPAKSPASTGDSELPSTALALPPEGTGASATQTP